MRDVTWILIIGATLGAWAALNVLCAERHRRVQAVDFEASARRQAALRQAERLAALARKQEAAGASAPAAPAARKPAN